MLLLSTSISISAIDERLSADVYPVDDNRISDYISWIVPISFITYGVIGIESDDLKLFNSEIKEEVNEHIDEKFTIDDVSQYVPFSAVYVLNSLGIDGKHSLRDRTLILGTAYGIMGTSVLTLKHSITLKRPDGSTNNSFPSGHTATAFMGAEFLYQEFKHESIWFGIAGYTIAAGTGAFRMYNDRHWFTDVVAGAGFGILSTKLSYLLYEKKLRHITSFSISPYANDNKYGLSVTF